MSETVTVRDLRNNSAEVLKRVSRGESLIITRDGDPVAQVTPLSKQRLSTAEIQRRLAEVPRVDYDAMRRDMDALIDPALDILGDQK